VLDCAEVNRTCSAYCMGTATLAKLSHTSSLADSCLLRLSRWADGSSWRHARQTSESSGRGSRGCHAGRRRHIFPDTLQQKQPELSGQLWESPLTLLSISADVSCDVALYPGCRGCSLIFLAPGNLGGGVSPVPAGPSEKSATLLLASRVPQQCASGPGPGHLQDPAPACSSRTSFVPWAMVHGGLSSVVSRGLGLMNATWSTALGGTWAAGIADCPVNASDT